MKWFTHNSTALSDAKIMKIISRFGIEGYGVYFATIEIIANELDQTKLDCILEHDVEVLSSKFNIDSSKLKSILDYCVEINLLSLSGSKYQCVKLLQRLDNTSHKNPVIKAFLKKYSETKNDSYKTTTSDVDILHRREENRREENRIDDNIDLKNKEEEDAHSQFVKDWNNVIAISPNISKMDFFTEARRDIFSKAEFDGLAMATVIDQVKMSDFLNGSFGWGFDWLFSEGKDGTMNWMKVQEGKYRDRDKPIGEEPEKKEISIQQKFPGASPELYQVIATIIEERSAKGEIPFSEDEITTQFGELETMVIILGDKWEEVKGRLESLFHDHPESFLSESKLTKLIGEEYATSS